MSATYWLEIDTGSSDGLTDLPDRFNVTYNLGPMLRAAGFPDWDALKGCPASEAAGVLDGVYRKLHDDKERVVAEFSPDEWGDWNWAVEFVGTFRAACAEHPKTTIGGWL